MDEYPDPEDEFEAMYAEELEVMRELQGFDPDEATIEAATITPSHKRSLDFRSPVAAVAPSTNDAEPICDANGVATATQVVEKQAPSRKRAPEETLGDSWDQALSEGLLGNKKKKRKPLLPVVDVRVRDPTLDLAAHEADLALLERIADMRRTLQEPDLPHQPASGTDNRTSRTTRIHQRVPDGAFQAITTETGQRYYLRCLEEEEWDCAVATVASNQHTTCLLSTSYSALKAQAHNEQIRRDALQAKRLQSEEDSGLESGTDDDNSNTEALWVEKFKPRHYLHLLSDESTNRSVLHWIKLWDKVVFGRDSRRHKKEAKKKDNFKDKPNQFHKKGQEVVEELDDQDRPVQKVVLLCGPPGLGKTTLAHTTAKHAGYNVVEINASDDRSVDTFRTQLENATSMQAVLGPNPRPNCLIIDEIDGAPAPSINLLVNVLNGKESAKKGKGKKKAGSILLQRPVICICNELYTPALRPLRQMALVVQFPPTHSARLAQRLLDISRARHLKADLSVLMALCDKTENDIRSCLSVLQFVRSTKRELSMGDVCGISVGQKDYQRSLFNIWHEIFSIPRQKRIIHNPLRETTTDSLTPMPDLNGDLNTIGEQNSLAFRFHHVLKATQNAPYEKVTQGWFENYLTIKQFTLMESITTGLEWATFNDLQMTEIQHSQAWLLMAYLPFTCVAYHFQSASHHWPKIQFPNQMNEMNQKLTKNKNLLAAMVGEMSASTRALAGTSQLVSDVLPFLVHIIQPTLRPVNCQLYNKEEKRELANLIDTMITYNLTYTQEKDLNGLYFFNLDPNIGEVVYFPIEKQRKELSYYSRQVISREVELEKVRRAEAYFSDLQMKRGPAKATVPTRQSLPTSATSSTTPTSLPSSATDTTVLPSNTTATRVPNHLQKLEVVPRSSMAVTTEKVQAPRDFFGRVIEQHCNDQPIRTSSNVIKNDIWYHFNEGYCNAVRKPIKMQDLAGPL